MAKFFLESSALTSTSGYAMNTCIFSIHNPILPYYLYVKALGMEGAVQRTLDLIDSALKEANLPTNTQLLVVVREIRY